MDVAKVRRHPPAVICLAAASLCAGLVSTPATAADGERRSGYVEEIVVTAQKREERLLDVPVSLSVIGADTIEQRGITGLNDLSGLAPNFNFDVNSARDERLIIRGISSDTRFIGSESAVGVVVDGVFMSGVSALNTELADIERIEVLRGPQGTLFGRNTTAGVVNIVTRRPDETPVFRAGIESGNQRHSKVVGVMSGPLIDGQLFGGLSLLRHSRDGYQEDAQGRDIDDQHLWSGRADLVWAPSDVWNVRWITDYQREEHSFKAIDFTPDDRVVEHAVFPPSMDREVLTTSLDLTRSLAGGGSVRAIGAYKRYDVDERIDADTFTLPTEMLTNPVLEQGDEQSLELQYTSPAGGRLEWLLGAYLQRQANEIDGRYEGDFDLFYSLTLRPAVSQVFGLPSEHSLRDALALFGAEANCNTAAPACFQARPDVSWRFETLTAAAFANVKLMLSESLDLQLGGRLSWEEKDYSYRSRDFYGLPFPDGNPFRIEVMSGPFATADSTSDVHFTPRAAISYAITPATTVYASAARGYKSGNFWGNVIGASDVNGNGRNDYLEFLAVGEETSWTYELGLKGAPSSRFRYDLGLYYIDYEGLQTQALLVNVLTNGQFNYLANADLRSYGVETEVHARVLEHVAVTLGGSYNDSEFTDYPSCSVVVGDVLDCTGNRPTYAPKWTGLADVDVDLPLPIGNLRLVANLSARYRGTRFFTVTNDLKDDGYWLYGATLGLEAATGLWSLTAFGENLADTDYATLQAAGASPLTAPGAPRTYGVRLTLRH